MGSPHGGLCSWGSLCWKQAWEGPGRWMAKAEGAGIPSLLPPHLAPGWEESEESGKSQSLLESMLKVPWSPARPERKGTRPARVPVPAPPQAPGPRARPGSPPSPSGLHQPRLPVRPITRPWRPSVQVWKSHQAVPRSLPSSARPAPHVPWRHAGWVPTTHCGPHTALPCPRAAGPGGWAALCICICIPTFVLLILINAYVVRNARAGRGASLVWGWPRWLWGERGGGGLLQLRPG